MLVNRFTRKGIMISYKENSVDAKTFIMLRKNEPFMSYEEADVEVALRNSLYTVLALDGSKPIGMARVVGDGRIAFFIKDVVVKREYRRRKIGTGIMNRVLSYIRGVCCDNAYVGLMATPHKEPFYQQLGFTVRPNAEHGAGMLMYIRKGEKQ